MSTPENPHYIPNGDLARTWLLGGLFFLGAMGFLALGSTILIPIFLGFFLSAVFAPPVELLMRLRVPQGLAAGLVVITFCVSVGGILSVIYAPAAEWQERAPELVSQIQEKLYPLRETIQRVQDTADQIEQATEIAPNDNEPQSAPQQQEPPLLTRLFTQARVVFGQAIASVIIAFFLLASRQRFFSQRLLATFGGTGRRLRVGIREAARLMTHYISTISLINAGVGILSGLVVYATGLPNPILWGVVVMLLSFIPYIGPAASLLGISLVSFLTFDDWWQIALPIFGFAAIHFVEGEFVTPAVLGRQMSLHPVWIIISILLWGRIWGLAGAFLAVPILLTVVTITRKVLLQEQENNARENGSTEGLDAMVGSA